MGNYERFGLVVFSLGRANRVAITALLSLWCAAQFTTLRTCVKVHLAAVVTFDTGRNVFQALVGTFA
jgi:hypothetical protein